jgi:guanylate kinase
MASLVLLSGPSCVGKSPLLKALQRFYPDLSSALRPLVLYNDRAPRPGEQDGVDYHFRPRAYIESLSQKPGFLVMPVRRDVQALEMAQVLRILDEGQDALFEGNAYIAAALMSAPELARAPRLSCFLSPLALEEIYYLRAQPDVELADLVREVQRRKLLVRTTKQKGVVSDQDREDLEARATAAYREMQYASQFDWVIPNHDGEGNDNWEAGGYPLGDARKALLDFAAILQGQQPRYAEKWPDDLFSLT